MGDRSAGYDCKTCIHVLPSKGNLTSLHTRFSHTRTRLPRTLLWTNFHCQQRFLARRLLCQHLWGQLKLTSSKEAPVYVYTPSVLFPGLSNRVPSDWQWKQRVSAVQRPCHPQGLLLPGVCVSGLCRSQVGCGSCLYHRETWMGPQNVCDRHVDIDSYNF